MSSGVGLAVAVLVGVGVLVDVGVACGVRVAVGVAVLVGVGVGVGVGVRVGVGVGVRTCITREYVEKDHAPPLPYTLTRHSPACAGVIPHHRMCSSA
jgi:hypothetical protein